METTAINELSLLNAIEVWHLHEDGRRLDLAGGLYRGVERFESLNRSSQSGSDEGLAGWTSAARVPVVFEDLNSTELSHGRATINAGSTSAIGLPVYDGHDITSVILFLCRQKSGVMGAFESWLPDDSRRELMLGTGYYSHLERFRRMSQYIRFPYGAGLPGEVWQTGMPRLINPLGDSIEFLRASGAHAEGLHCGMALPLISDDDMLRSVFVMLSSECSPLARVFQIWTPLSGTREFELSDTATCGVKNLECLASELHYSPGEGLVGRVLKSRRAILTLSFEDEKPGVAEAAAGAGITWALAWPVIAHHQIQAVCVLMD